ncbi:MAG: alkyldihydroxyacetonephosphate synthase, partial [Frankiaceae bacterium]|nr:alkyldihydroxyacetonephosphate synthase [Frankiaceae bacterium]
MTLSTYPVWGWSRDPAAAPKPADLEALAPLVAGHLGLPVQPPEQPAPLAELPADLVTGRLPASLRELSSAEPLDRAAHALGRSYVDIVRGIRGQLDHVPDTVLRPRTEAEVSAVLDWCGDNAVALVPYSGGTSVVGGVEPAVGDRWSGVVSLDVSGLAGVREVDPVSRAVRVGGGTPGPRLEDELRDHGLTARFYPQSFERSTVGGWVVTRA